MAEVWTLARWTVVPGREDEFVAAWQELAQWTLTEFPAAKGTLLRDRDEPNVFFSFGPWEDQATAARWRGSEGFRQRIAGLRPLLESFEPHLLDRRLSVEAGGPA